MARIDTLGFFAGGVPASVLFQIATMNIRKLVRNNDNAEALRTLPELCFIGLVAYFEAFCRDCFASILNLAPQLIQLLKNRSYEVRIDPMTVLEMQKELPYRLGFLVSEGLDFGTSKKINALYNAILSITPFSKQEQIDHDLLLSDRNLLVHHGGIYTQSYIKQRFLTPSGLSRVFMDSLQIDEHYLAKRTNFLLKIAKKITKSCKSALVEKTKANEILLTVSSKSALKLFDYWDDDEIVDG